LLQSLTTEIVKVSLTPVSRRCPRAARAGVGEAPRHEIAGVEDPERRVRYGDLCATEVMVVMGLDDEFGETLRAEGALQARGR